MLVSISNMRGPKPDMKMIKLVSSYRKRGLSTREIARLIKKDQKQVMRWIKSEDKLSTG